MGKKWDNEIAFSSEIWAEALRIAKPGATLLAFGGTRTYHRLTCAIEDAGWEIRDCISYFHDGTQAERAFMASLSDEQLGAYLELHHPGAGIGWVYGSGFPKSANISKQLDKAAGAEREVVGKNHHFCNGRHADPGSFRQGGKNGSEFITAPATPLAAKFDGYGTALKPAHEPIVVAMKPIDQSFAANAEKWGVSGLWIDGGRVGIEEGDKRGEGGRLHKPKADTAMFGNTVGSEMLPTDVGRWPANVIHSGEPEVLAEFDKAGVRTSGARNGGAGYKLGNYEGQKGHWGLKNNYPCEGSQGSAARYFAQCPPDPTAHPDAARFHYCPKAGKRERGKGNNHPTVKPLSLLRYLAKLTRPPDGGIVLDPFGGSGTTALAAIAEGRDYIIIEKEPEYAELCRRRIAEYSGAEVAPVEVKVKSEVVKQMALW